MIENDIDAFHRLAAGGFLRLRALTITQTFGPDDVPEVDARFTLELREG